MAISVKLLRTAQSAVNASTAYRSLGNVDAKVVMQSGKSAYLVTFRAFQCVSVVKIPLGDIRDGDFTIEMTPGEWRDYFAARRAGDGKSLVELDLEKNVIKAANVREKQGFYRYHLSLQQFIDAGADAGADAA